MKNGNYLGISQDGSYLFTNKGVFTAKGHGNFTKFDRNFIPKLIEIAQDNNEYELKKGLITLKEYSSKPKKIFETLLSSLPKTKSSSILKEWEKRYDKKIVNESTQKDFIKSTVNESFESIKTIFLEQNQVYSTAVDISNKIIDALSKTFNDDEEEALKQVKRINNVDLLNNVEKVIKSKKNMSLINYLNDEMSDVDTEYKAIYQHLQSLKSDYSKGYKENKFYQAVGTGLDGLAAVGAALSKAAQAIIIPIIKRGVIPLMRWIRRNLNTYVGIIVDVILSLLPTVVVMKVIWGLICLLDIYEIATGDFDPDDPERKQMPFVYLVGDLLAWALTAAFGKAASISLRAAVKAGKVQGTASVGILKKALNYFPKLKNGLGVVKEFLNKLFGAGNLISKLFGYIDNVVTSGINWIKTLLKETGKAAGTVGLGQAGLALGLGVGMAEFMVSKSFGEGKSGIYGRGKEVRKMQQSLKRMTERNDEFSVGYNGPVTGIYDKQLGDAIYKLYQKLKMTPKREATPYVAGVLGVVMEPSGLFKLIGEENMANFGSWITRFNSYFTKMAKKMGGNPQGKKENNV